MRHQTHAYRVAYGEPIFVIFSPSEKDSALMVRLSRTRRTDPCHLAGPNLAKWASEDVLSLNDDFTTIPVDELADALPTFAERQKLLARDPLACADGFRVLCRLASRKLFGVRFCTKCPDCNFSRKCCQDVFGSSATPEGVFLVESTLSMGP